MGEGHDVTNLGSDKWNTCGDVATDKWCGDVAKWQVLISVGDIRIRVGAFRLLELSRLPILRYWVLYCICKEVRVSHI